MTQSLTNLLPRLGATAKSGPGRSNEGIGVSWPLRRIDEQGAVIDVGVLHVYGEDHYFLSCAKGSPPARVTFNTGLPYFLQDQRPSGFLGQAVPQQCAELELPPRVIDWNDNHYLRYLTHRGGDSVGDLILGEVALERHLSLRSKQSPVSSEHRKARYPQLAAEVMLGAASDSLVPGDRPKFVVLLEDHGQRQHVIVKFSPELDTPIGERWGDLLLAEHVAHVHLQAAGIPACTSRIYTFANRRFLEIDRFDRVGNQGRTGVTSLFSIDTGFYGRLDTWIDAATRMHASGQITTETLEQVRLAATFGNLIANTDQHFGNLAFFDRYEGDFRLAPIYDMLPMLFAPQHDQTVPRTFEPPAVNANTFRAWERAQQLAIGYWSALAADKGMSADFQSVANTCERTLRGLAPVKSSSASA